MNAKKTIGFCMTGSFCTFEAAFRAMAELKEEYDLLPVFSEHAASMDTRFGKAADHIRRAEEIAGRKAICTLTEAEPIGPKKLTDLMVVAPCTGNTLAKLANSIVDTTATLAVKSHLRGRKPVVIAVSSNDALAGSAKNIGHLQNYRHYYFVPYRQDAPFEKQTSLVADFSLLLPAVEAAFRGEQLQPMVREK